jgi:hypothetical protein
MKDAILGLDTFDSEQTIFTTAKLSPELSSPAIVDYDDEGMPPATAQGMRYLLEVSLAREAIAVWSAWRGGREPTLEEKLAAIVYYAENDAYLPLEE